MCQLILVFKGLKQQGKRNTMVLMGTWNVSSGSCGMVMLFELMGRLGRDGMVCRHDPLCTCWRWLGRETQELRESYCPPQTSGRALEENERERSFGTEGCGS